MHIRAEEVFCAMLNGKSGYVQGMVVVMGGLIAVSGGLEDISRIDFR